MRALLKQWNSLAFEFLGAKKNRKYLVLFLLVLGGLFTQAILRTVVYYMSDFNMFIDPAIGARFNGFNPIEKWDCNSYSPFYYAIMSVFTPFAQWFAITLWTAISLCCFYWSVGIVHFLIKGALPPFKRELIIAPLVLVFPFFDNVQLGQSNFVLLFSVLVGVYYVATNKTWKAAITLGFAIAFKITPAAFGLFLIMKKKFKMTVLTGVLAVGFTVVVPMFIYSPQRSIEFLESWSDKVLMPFISGEELKTLNTGFVHTNQSLDAFLGRHFTDFGCVKYEGLHCSIDPAFLSIEQVKTVGKIAKLFIIGFLVLLFIPKAPPSGYRTIYQASIFLIAILFISPASWLNHFIIILPAVIIAVNEIRLKLPGSRTLMYLTGFLFVCLAVSVDPVIQSFSLYFIGTLVFLIGYSYHYFKHFLPREGHSGLSKDSLSI